MRFLLWFVLLIAGLIFAPYVTLVILVFAIPLWILWKIPLWIWIAVLVVYLIARS